MVEIKQIGITTGGEKKEFMAIISGESTSSDVLTELNANHLDSGVGSSCLMKNDTRDVAMFDGAEWFIW